MLIIQTDKLRAGFTVSSSPELSRYFSDLAERHGITLEEAVIRALVPLVCASVRSPVKEQETLEERIERKVQAYPDRPIPATIPDNPERFARSTSQATFTWSLSKRHKAELSVLAESDNRTLSNWLTWTLPSFAKALLYREPVTLTYAQVEQSVMDKRKNP